MEANGSWGHFSCPGTVANPNLKTGLLGMQSIKIYKKVSRGYKIAHNHFSGVSSCWQCVSLYLWNNPGIFLLLFFWGGGYRHGEHKGGGAGASDRPEQLPLFTCNIATADSMSAFRCSDSLALGVVVGTLNIQQALWNQWNRRICGQRRGIRAWWGWWRGRWGDRRVQE